MNQNKDLNFHFTSFKAGMEGLDKQSIEKIIYEQTKDSVITKKKESDFKKIELEHKEHLIKLNSVHKNELKFNELMNLTHKRINEIKIELDLSRIWMHIDMDMFYAAVEIRDNPSLGTKPIAVGDKSMISTSNYIARKFGVRSAMPGFIAEKLCKDLIFVKPNFGKYKTESNSIMEILRYYDKDLDQAGLDEAYLDLTDFCEKNYIFEEAEINELAKEIKMKIYDKTKLTCSIGFGCNRMLAKICSDQNKPDGVFILKRNEETITNFMRKLNIRKIPGIGPKTETKLNLMKIFTCQDILEKCVDLYVIYDKTQFDHFISSALGISRNYHIEKGESKSISSSNTFKSTDSNEEIEKEFSNISKSLIEKMNKERCQGKTLGIEIKTGKEEHECKSYTHKDFLNEELIFTIGLKLLKGLIEGRSVRLIRVKISNLSFSDPKKKNLKIQEFFKKQNNFVKENNEYNMETVEEIKQDYSNEKNKDVFMSEEKFKKPEQKVSKEIFPSKRLSSNNVSQENLFKFLVERKNSNSLSETVNNQNSNEKIQDHKIKTPQKLDKKKSSIRKRKKNNSHMKNQSLDSFLLKK